MATLKVTRGLPPACQLAEFINMYGSIPLKSIHVHWKMLSIRSSKFQCYPFVVQKTHMTLGGDLTLTHEVDALFKRCSQLDVCCKIILKTKVFELVFSDTTSMCLPLKKVKTKGPPKSMKSIKCEP